MRSRRTCDFRQPSYHVWQYTSRDEHFSSACAIAFQKFARVTSLLVVHVSIKLRVQYVILKHNMNKICVCTSTICNSSISNIHPTESMQFCSESISPTVRNEHVTTWSLPVISSNNISVYYLRSGLFFIFNYQSAICGARMYF